MVGGRSISRAPLLSVRQLSIGLPQVDRPLVRDLSFELRAGTTLGLTGASGVGKSLTARCLVGLMGAGPQVLQGHMMLRLPGVGDPYPLHNLPARRWRDVRRRGISLVNQDPQSSLNPIMRVGKQLRQAAYGLGCTQTELHEALDLVGMSHMLSRLDRNRPQEFSGGEQQRLLIAMAILGKPRLLIADEPTTALDTITEAGVIATLEQLREELGMAMIFISHDLNLLARVCPRAIWLRPGQRAVQGTVDEIERRYGRPPLAHAPLSSQHQRRPSLLWVNNLDLGYGTTPVVRSCGFSIRRREWLALVGPSGCGKTTLARWLVGLLPAQAGRLYSPENPNGTAVTNLSGRQQRRLTKAQLVFQSISDALNPRMTVGQLIEEVVRQHHCPERTEDLLHAVGLTGRRFLEAYPAELSGGQRQRVAIARALAAGPQLLICDEAVASLDYSLRWQILALLDRLRQERQLTILFITHDMSLVRAHADRILIMQDGHIVERGPAKVVLRQPRSKIGKALLAAISRGGTYGSPGTPDVNQN